MRTKPCAIYILSSLHGTLVFIWSLDHGRFQKRLSDPNDYQFPNDHRDHFKLRKCPREPERTWSKQNAALHCGVSITSYNRNDRYNPAESGFQKVAQITQPSQQSLLQRCLRSLNSYFPMVAERSFFNE